MTGIARQRRSMFLTQKKLAEMLGVAPVTVAKWETRQSNPTVKRLKAMSELFNCTVDELLQEF